MFQTVAVTGAAANHTTGNADKPNGKVVDAFSSFTYTINAGAAGGDLRIEVTGGYEQARLLQCHVTRAGVPEALTLPIGVRTVYHIGASNPLAVPQFEASAAWAASHPRRPTAITAFCHMVPWFIQAKQSVGHRCGALPTHSDTDVDPCRAAND